ncbi:MAG: DNA polymerase III subunit delta [Sandaracinus sp.]
MFDESEERDIQSLLQAARRGEWEPVVVLVGGETFLIERAVRLLRKASVGDGPRGFNDDLFHGSGLAGAKVAAAARTLPMMARSRFVLVRGAQDAQAAELDALAGYVADPSPSTCFVITAEKIDGKTKLAKAAKASKAWLSVEPLKGGLLERFATGEAKRRGHAFEGPALAALLDATGNDLAAIDDAIERLSLYVGEGHAITKDAVEATVTRVRVDSIWALVDAIAQKRTKVAMEATLSMLGDREPALRILAMVARQVRMVAKMKSGLESGLSPADAVKAAGAPPFKARELGDSARKFSDADLRRALVLLRDADVALKGSKREPEIVMEETVLALCR